MNLTRIHRTLTQIGLTFFVDAVYFSVETMITIGAYWHLFCTRMPVSLPECQWSKIRRRGTQMPLLTRMK